jgi:FXSXX-COOH protein
MNAEQREIASSLINIGHLSFQDLDLIPDTVLARALDRVRREAREATRPDAKFESALIRDVGE